VSDWVALVFQPFRPETRILAEECGIQLRARGVESRLLAATHLDAVPSARCRFALTCGGDGTVLRAAAWLVGSGVPIVPVRMGTLSFLGELEPGEVLNALDPLLEGRFRTDARRMLRVRHAGRDAIGLNEAVLGRGAASRAMRLDVYVDHQPLGRYTADGMVAATPTGSTAYALAAGGPIMAPWIPAFLLVPIAPHLTLLRALVLPDSSTIRMVVHTVQPAVLTVDGHLDLPVSDGQEVCVDRAEQSTVFGRLGPEAEFFRALESRLARRG
jgi:NAD+ kinase